MYSTCFGHEYIHHQELANVLLNYHIKSPTHNELRTKRPLW